MPLIEEHKINIKEHEFTIKIYDKNTRFNDEGILEMITLHVDNKEMYRDTFGREKTLNFLLSDFDNEFVDISHEKINKRYYFSLITGSVILSKNNHDIFTNWLIECLTDKNIKRINKINRIKNKICKV